MTFVIKTVWFSNCHNIVITVINIDQLFILNYVCVEIGEPELLSVFEIYMYIKAIELWNPSDRSRL